jgi:hypothetical protein
MIIKNNIKPKQIRIIKQCVLLWDIAARLCARSVERLVESIIGTDMKPRAPINIVTVNFKFTGWNLLSH